ncbi:Elongation factor 1-alpha [Cucumispora dikerogammari]|nr:Elongation factor 1-alpha [Cucumispora dikerogammari]
MSTTNEIKSIGISLTAIADPDAPSIKPYLNVCFIGHVDSGKSTTVGHLQYLLGGIDKRTLDKLAAEADKLGRGTFKFAYSMDRTKAERERGITIETSLQQLKTEKYDLNIIDCPGHKDFIKNMVTGAAQADVAVVIVPCADNEFESAISGGTLKDHIVVAGVLGCKKVIVCVNKVDTVPEARRPTRFKEVADEMKALVKKNHPDKLPIIIPISGYEGTGLTEANEKYSWFTGFTPEADPSVKIFSLEAALNYQTAPKRDFKKPLRMPITSTHKIPGVGSVFAGRVDAGTIKPNMKIEIQPLAITGDVKTVEIHGKPQVEVFCGQNCGVAIKTGKAEDLKKIKAGFVISEAGPDALKMGHGAVVKVLITDHRGHLKTGYSPTMDIGTQHVPTRLAKFLEKVQTSNPKVKIENPEEITKGDAVVAIMVPKKEIAFEALQDYPSLGKFALRDLGHIVGIGSIMKKLNKEQLALEYQVEYSLEKKKTAAAPAAAARRKG